MLLLRRPPDLVCQQVVELVTGYLEGTMSRRERARFDAHLRRCDNCTRYLEQIRVTIAATGTLRAEDVDPEAIEELTGLFRTWWSEGGGNRV